MSDIRPIHTLLVANRGEIALRILRTCRDLGIRTVAVYSDADAAMPFVRHADLAVRIGPPPSSESYLRGDRIIDAALRCGADAIHPGYGFLAENGDFSAAVRDAGLLFVGPGPDSIYAMGDKTAARRLVAAAGVPTIPGSDGPVDSEADAAAFAERFGFPVLLKAAAGGGGKGMRVAQNAGELASGLRAARSEARSSFGDDRIYIEKFLDRPRHIEVQILADRTGAAIHLGERECSIQRRHQKVIEESPSPAVDPSMRAAMGETAVRAAQACGYENAGTIEFLVDSDGRYYFLEMNTRLQVEHPVTELRTGLDLVAEQIRIAEGHPLPFGQDAVTFRGHAIECRICAEDPAAGFMPSTGTILHLRAPEGPGVREDRGFEEGGTVPVFYDSLLSKLVVWGGDRDTAIRRMRRALREYELLGVHTNIPLCRFVLDHPFFERGEVTTAFLSEHFAPEHLSGSCPEGDLAAAAAVAAHITHKATSRLVVQESGSRDGHGLGGWILKRRESLR